MIKKTEKAAIFYKKCYAIPMYIVDYIFDGSELDDKEMKIAIHETAQYSIHCVGLVFCP